MQQQQQQQGEAASEQPTHDEEEEEEEGERQRVAALEKLVADQRAMRKSLEMRAKIALSSLAERRAEEAKISAKLEAAELKCRALQGEDVRFREKQAFEPNLSKAVEQIPLSEALEFTQSRLEQIRARATAGSSSLLLPNLHDIAMTISVEFNADEARFGLTRETTFLGLKEECIRHWGLDPNTMAEFRSLVLNERFPMERTVMDVLPVHPSIRFHVFIVKEEDEEEEEEGAKESGDGAEVASNRVSFRQQVVPEQSHAQQQRGVNEKGALVPSPVRNSSRPRPRIALIRKLQKLAWEAQVREESVFYETQTAGARSCWWIIAWALVLALYISAMVYRFNTASAYSSVLQLHQALGETSFNTTTSLPPRQASFFHSMLTVDQVAEWAEQVLLPYIASGNGGQLLGGVRISFAFQYLCGNDTALVDGGGCPNGTEPLYLDWFSHLSNYQGVVCQTTWWERRGNANPAEILRSGGDSASNLGLALFQFNLLNVNQGAVVQVACLVEEVDLLVVPRIQVNVLPLSVFGSYYQTMLQPLIIVSDVLVTLFACALLAQLVLGGGGSSASVLLWRLIALALGICVVVQLCLAINFDVAVGPSVDVNATTFQDLDYQVEQFNAYLSMSCASLFLLLLLAGRFVQWHESRSVRLMFRVLNRALSRNFASIIFLFVCTLASMSIWANLAFGPYLKSWTDIQSCVSQLAALAFGASVDFYALRSSQYTLLWLTLFFLIWFAGVFLLLTQLFTVCVLDAFLEVYALANHEEKRTAAEEDAGDASKQLSLPAALSAVWSLVTRARGRANTAA